MVRAKVKTNSSLGDKQEKSKVFIYKHQCDQLILLKLGMTVCTTRMLHFKNICKKDRIDKSGREMVLHINNFFQVTDNLKEKDLERLWIHSLKNKHKVGYKLLSYIHH